MRRFLLLSLGAVVCSTALAADGESAAARRLLLSGKYAEAVDAYRPLAHQAAGAVGLARAHESQGQLKEALAALEQGPADSSAIAAELARLALARGDYPTSRQHVEQALKLDGRQPLARWIAAELDRLSGRLDEADKGCRSLVRLYNQQKIDDPEALRWIGRAAAQNARWNQLSDQFHFLVNDLYPEALKLDAAFWPAHYEAGLLFLEKYNQADAAAELKKALALNPNAAEVHAAMAALALASRDVAGAQRHVARAIEICPALIEAWHLRADIHWVNFQPEAALRLLEEKALRLNPRDEQTLGRIAACHLLLEGRQAAEPQSRFSRAVEKVKEQNPRPGEFYFTLALLLEARNKQAEAEKYFRTAIEVMPRLVGPRAELGLLCMRAGREDDARSILREAFRADPFHVRVNNMLDVLDVLDGMGTHETERFVIRYDAGRDKLLARYAGRHLERVHPRLCRLFGYEPPPRSLVEVFSAAKGQGGHAWFSARMTGLPYVGTVAASTGRIVAMTSPQEHGARGFNWARVLTHEYVHVITLQQTDFNIPHWYTEGLAVWCEGGPRPHAWTEVLAKRLAEAKLFTLEDLNFGFQRPQSGEDWTLAYCQAELYVELMLELGGEESLRKLLAAYAEGLSTPQAIERTFGMTQDRFEEHYRRFAASRAAPSRLKRPSSRDFASLAEARRERPEDLDTAAELAAAYLDRGASREADDMANGVLAKSPNHPLAACVWARLRLRALGGKGDGEKAAVDRQMLADVMARLVACLDEQSPHAGVLTLLAALRLKAKDFDEAARLFELARRCEPDNPAWVRSLARIHLLTDNETRLYDTLAEVARLDEDDFTARKKLAEMAYDRKDYVGACDWAREAIEIDVTDADVHRLLAQALVNRRQLAESIEEFEAAVELKDDDPEAYFGLADALMQLQQSHKALGVLRRLIKIKPDYPGAAELIEELEK